MGKCNSKSGPSSTSKTKSGGDGGNLRSGDNVWIWFIFVTSGRMKRHKDRRTDDWGDGGGGSWKVPLICDGFEIVCVWCVREKKIERKNGVVRFFLEAILEVFLERARQSHQY